MSREHLQEGEENCFKMKKENILYYLLRFYQRVKKQYLLVFCLYLGLYNIISNDSNFYINIYRI